jgi:pimeloyl-ACP methyl ester carboxylesterase
MAVPESRRLNGALALALIGAASARPALADDSLTVLTLDHYVQQQSAVPAIEGDTTLLYVRERVQPATIARGGSLEDRVVLFVHGAGTPAEVAFDVPYGSFSWMAHLAGAGYDVFSVDMTGYGRSTRPPAMNDPCNLPEEAQRALGIGIARAPCTPSHPGPATTIASDWADIDAAVDYLRELRGVERVHLIGWSLGGPRAGGYSAQHPEKVGRLVLLAPAYNRMSPTDPPGAPDMRPAMGAQSRADFMNTWNAPQNCPGQREAAVGEAIITDMLASDRVGATWGPGIRRAPNVTTWGWNESVVRRQTTPLLAIAAANDQAVDPARVRELYEDYGADEKILIDLGCASHSPMWEGVHGVLFAATLEWLRAGTVTGQSEGVIQLGY